MSICCSRIIHTYVHTYIHTYIHTCAIDDRTIFCVKAKISEHGSVDAIIADLLNNLAACYEVMGDVVSAMKFYQESLKLRQVAVIRFCSGRNRDS